MMIIIKCCGNCDNYDDNTCTVDCHCTTADDWCPRWEEEDNGDRHNESDDRERR